jgi:gas vesicle protein
MNSTTAKLVLATLGGVAIGSALGILLAPEAGAKTRRKLTGATNSFEDHMDDILSKGKKSWRNMKNEAEDKSEDMEEYLEHLVAEGKKSWRKMQSEIADKAEDAGDVAESFVSKVVREGKGLWNDMKAKSQEVATTAENTVKSVARDVRETAQDGVNNAKRQLEKADAELS